MGQHFTDIPFQTQIHHFRRNIVFFLVIILVEKPFRCLRMPYQHMTSDHDLSVRVFFVPSIDLIQHMLCSGIIQYRHFHLLSMKLCGSGSGTFLCAVIKQSIGLQFISEGNSVKMGCDNLPHLGIIQFLLGGCTSDSTALYGNRHTVPERRIIHIQGFRSSIRFRHLTFIIRCFFSVFCIFRFIGTLVSFRIINNFIFQMLCIVRCFRHFTCTFHLLSICIRHLFCSAASGAEYAYHKQYDHIAGSFN